MLMLSPDLNLSEDRIQELDRPVTDEQFRWLEQRGLLDNGKTYEENVADNLRRAEIGGAHDPRNDREDGENNLCECGRREDECATFDDPEADHGDR